MSDDDKYSVGGSALPTPGVARSTPLTPTDTAATRHLMQAEKDMEAVILAGEGDREAAHGEADAILCRALKLLGYRRLVDLYEQVPKWYA